MTSVEAVVYGQPVPCPRPRVLHKPRVAGASFGGERRASAFYPQRYTDWRNDAQVMIRDACIKQLGAAPRWRSYVTVIAEFYGASDQADIDNLLKSVLDALQGIVIENDRQVRSVVASRHPPCGAGKAMANRKTVVRVIQLDPLEVGEAP